MVVAYLPTETDTEDYACPGCGQLACGCDDDIDIGVCWCGAYGPAGAIHVAKPSASEPPEECGTYL